MKQWITYIVFFCCASYGAAKSDSIIEPERISDSISTGELAAMDTVADASNAYYQVRVLQPPAASREKAPKNRLYIAFQRLGQRIEEVYRLKELANPKVERIELGQLCFTMTVSYGFDLSTKKVTATLRLDRLMNTKK
jgi:hypothetical protein